LSYTTSLSEMSTTPAVTEEVPTIVGLVTGVPCWLAPCAAEYDGGWLVGVPPIIDDRRFDGVPALERSGAGEP
jgi:hypothetical protein